MATTLSSFEKPKAKQQFLLWPLLPGWLQLQRCVPSRLHGQSSPGAGLAPSRQLHCIQGFVGCIPPYPLGFPAPPAEPHSPFWTEVLRPQPTSSFLGKEWILLCGWQMAHPVLLHTAPSSPCTLPGLLSFHIPKSQLQWFPHRINYWTATTWGLENDPHLFRTARLASWHGD